MNNYKTNQKEKLTSFKLYLMNKKMVSNQTASDYVNRIIKICIEEDLSVEDLKNKGDKLLYEYTEGSKKELGDRSHNS